MTTDYATTLELRCPVCDYHIRTPREDFDPPSAVLAEMLCLFCLDDCPGWREPPTYYYDAQGRELTAWVPQ